MENSIKEKMSMTTYTKATHESKQQSMTEWEGLSDLELDNITAGRGPGDLHNVALACVESGGNWEEKHFLGIFHSYKCTHTAVQVSAASDQIAHFTGSGRVQVSASDQITLAAGSTHLPSSDFILFS